MTIVFGAIHTSELDRSENGLSPNRSECERSNANWVWFKIDLNECEHFLKANWDRSKIDLNECEHFLKANWDRSQIDPT